MFKKLVSTDANGDIAAFEPLRNINATNSSSVSSVSADGRYVVFSSSAVNLVDGVSGNPARQIYLKDTLTGDITQIEETLPVLSPDGLYLVFTSAEALLDGDTNGVSDVLVRDLATGVVTRVNTDSDGAQRNGATTLFDLAISPGARYVAFVTEANDLVDGDTNNQPDVFLKNTLTGELLRVSTSSSGQQFDNYSNEPVISDDGRYVLFNVTEFEAPFQRGTAYVKNTQTGETTFVSTDSFGMEALGLNGSSGIAISGDGRYVLFRTDSDDLFAEDADNGNWDPDIFIKDTVTGTTTLVSANSDGAAANDSTIRASMSSDGRYVAFQSGATNLVANDTNGKDDIFVKDILTGEIVRVSVLSDGSQSAGGADHPIVSADGNHVVFQGGDEFVEGDTNGVREVLKATNPLALANDIVELYIAYFDRAPEWVGLRFHIDATTVDMQAGQTFEEALARRGDQFFEAAIAAPEYSGYSVNQPVSEFLETMYTNVLLRPGPGGLAPNSDELGYWQEKLASGELTRGEIVIEFLDAIDFLQEEGTPEQIIAAAQVELVLQNRLEVSLAFDKEEYSGGLTGEDAYNAGRSILMNVDETRDGVEAALAKLTGSMSETTSTALVGFDYSGGSLDDDEPVELVGTDSLTTDDNGF